jgi:hypothetical protein
VSGGSSRNFGASGMSARVDRFALPFARAVFFTRLARLDFVVCRFAISTPTNAILQVNKESRKFIDVLRNDVPTGPAPDLFSPRPPLRS